MSGLPIGVFDSGLGGLTVLKSLKAELPSENFIYLGDLARLPYGTKSPEVITKYALRCLDFLSGQKVKAIVVACNTASALALEAMKSASDGKPIFGVVASGARAAVAVTRSRRIGVLATSSTVKSEAYSKEIFTLDSTAKVYSVACPLLVPLAEEGWFDSSVTEEIIRHYAQQLPSDIDTYVLGCTHYPLLENSFRRVFGDAVNLIHSGPFVAKEIRSNLSDRLNTDSAPGALRFFATDSIGSSERILKQLFGGSSRFEIIDL